MLPIEKACYWMTTEPYQYEPVLEGEQSCDIAIVGAGFTGLWTGVFLKDLAPDKDIVIVEQGMAGYGGSGRNAGMLDVTIDHSHALAITHFGFQEAKRLAEIGRKNIEEMATFLSQNDIDCDFERNGRFFVALTEAQMKGSVQDLEVAERLGVAGMRLLSADEIQAEVHSPLYLGALFAPSPGIINPFKLVQGLKQYLKLRGVRIFEKTKVTALCGGAAQTDHGKLLAHRFIAATDAFTHHLFPKLLRRYIPLYDYILVSDPLTSLQKEAIGWKGRQGITDGRTFFNYYRLTADDRILWGTSEAMYYAPNRVNPECDHSERHYSALRESFRRHFPQLAELPFPFAWGGPIASTTRMTPFFGSLENGRILYALGYTGHGIGSTRLAGRILAHMALERSSDLFKLSIVQKKPFPYPPEPFRSFAVEAVTKALRKTDAGHRPSLLLRLLDSLGIGFSS